MTVIAVPASKGGWAKSEQGIAMLTVLLIMLMMTVLGISAVTVTGLENRMAGFMTSMEGATAAAESCTGIGVNIIQQTLEGGTVPAAFLSSATPAGPVPQTNATILNQEVGATLANNNDSPDGAGAVPNLVLTVGAYTVNGDIDFLYTKQVYGDGRKAIGAYDGGAGGSAVSSTKWMYRIDCVARNMATGTSARVTAVYACRLSGAESCQR